MLIEIPDPEVILSVILAFIIGLGGLFAYHKLKPMIKTKESTESQKERLEYYERQLIDMKIRLDSLEMQNFEENPKESSLELQQILKSLKQKEVEEKPNLSQSEPKVSRENKISSNVPNLDTNNPIDYVLHLITNKAMTSRDIQITLKRSREHTSRLMKKLFDDGYVKRNTNSKPYTYSISEKGKEKIGLLEPHQTVG